MKDQDVKERLQAEIEAKRIKLEQEMTQASMEDSK